jgi:hypothetical protein
VLSRSHVAAGERGIDRCGFFSASERDWIDWARRIQPIKGGEIEEHTGDGAVADLRGGVPVTDVHFGITAIDCYDEVWPGSVGAGSSPKFKAPRVTLTLRGDP